jgi:hypothetical protein
MPYWGVIIQRRLLFAWFAYRCHEAIGMPGIGDRHGPESVIGMGRNQ